MNLFLKQKLIVMGFTCCLATTLTAQISKPFHGCQSAAQLPYPVGVEGLLFERTFCDGVCNTCRVYQHEVQILRSSDLQSPKRLFAKRSISIDSSTHDNIQAEIETVSQSRTNGFRTFNRDHETFAFLPSGEAVLLEAHRIGGCEESNSSTRASALIKELSKHCLE